VQPSINCSGFFFVAIEHQIHTRVVIFFCVLSFALVARRFLAANVGILVQVRNAQSAWGFFAAATDKPAFKNRATRGCSRQCVGRMSSKRPVLTSIQQPFSLQRHGNSSAWKQSASSTATVRLRSSRGTASKEAMKCHIKGHLWHSSDAALI
jgi:hypothetical protein